jgi:hypothetical protein
MNNNNPNTLNHLEVDVVRVAEGLPTDVTITPQDFKDNPELAQIFEVSDTSQNLDLIIQSDEHFQMVEAITTFLSNFS